MTTFLQAGSDEACQTNKCTDGQTEKHTRPIPTFPTGRVQDGNKKSITVSVEHYHSTVSLCHLHHLESDQDTAFIQG